MEAAIEASREQLEERLACKLNTPLHEPQIAAATQEFVCNYTSSLSHRSSLPALGEINLRFKRKWTSMPSSSTHDHHRPYNHAASAHTTKWLLPQNTKLLQNEAGNFSFFYFYFFLRCFFSMVQSSLLINLLNSLRMKQLL